MAFCAHCLSQGFYRVVLLLVCRRLHRVLVGLMGLMVSAGSFVLCGGLNH